MADDDAAAATERDKIYDKVSTAHVVASRAHSKRY